MTPDPLEDGRQEFMQRVAQRMGTQLGEPFTDYLPYLRSVYEAAWTARAAREREWIPVSERLPDEDELVLVCVWCEWDDHDGVTQRWQEVHEATLYKSPLQLIAVTADAQEYENGEITHWMPLPDLPEAALSESKAEE